VHKEKVNIAGVVNQEGLVAGWHHVAGFLVGSETNLYPHQPALCVIRSFGKASHKNCMQEPFQPSSSKSRTYRWHNHLSLEPSSDTVINTLGLSPAWVDTFVGIALMSVETLGAYKCTCQLIVPPFPSSFGSAPISKCVPSSIDIGDME
jgi:hypothetical protein